MSVLQHADKTGNPSDILMRRYYWYKRNGNGFFFLVRGRSLLGYHKRDIALQSSYCMIHFDDIPVLQTLHNDCK